MSRKGNFLLLGTEVIRDKESRRLLLVCKRFSKITAVGEREEEEEEEEGKEKEGRGREREATGDKMLKTGNSR